MAYRPLLNLFIDEVLSGCYVSIDETTLQVLQEPARIRLSDDKIVYVAFPPRKPGKAGAHLSCKPQRQ